jgi:hypothetical protein
MISLRTSADWTALVVEVVVAPDPGEIFSNTTKTSAYEAMVDFDAWLNDAARAWFGVVSFSWRWARDPTTGGALLILTAAGGLFSIDAGAQSTLGFSLGVGQSTTTGAAALGTIAPVGGVAVRAHMRQLAVGDACTDGAVRPGVPGAAHYRPSVSFVGDSLDAGRTAAMLATASNPRIAVVWQKHLDAWRTLAIGPIARTVASTHHYKFDLNVSGEVL